MEKYKGKKINLIKNNLEFELLNGEKIIIDLSDSELKQIEKMIKGRFENE